MVINEVLVVFEYLRPTYVRFLRDRLKRLPFNMTKTFRAIFIDTILNKTPFGYVLPYVNVWSMFYRNFGFCFTAI